MPPCSGGWRDQHPDNVRAGPRAESATDRYRHVHLGRPRFVLLQSVVAWPTRVNLDVQRTGDVLTGSPREVFMNAKKRVLVLCTGNSCRSQMAEGWINHELGESWEACSAGTVPAERVNPLAIRAMAEVDIDISDGKPKLVGPTSTSAGTSSLRCAIRPRRVVRFFRDGWKSCTYPFTARPKRKARKRSAWWCSAACAMRYGRSSYRG